MKEEFLHFVWQYLCFETRDLTLENGEELQILKQGNYQTNEGPDFENCEVRINDIHWVGKIEIHLKSSDWYRHHHDQNKAYDNVILHVVWDHDKDVIDGHGYLLPVLSLKGRIDSNIFANYTQLLSAKHEIMCGSQLGSVSKLKQIEMLDKAVTQRLRIKSDLVLTRLAKNDGDWEETTYQLLMQNFGFKINNDAFLQLSLALPYKIIKKHSDQLFQVEALLFGQAGLLEAIDIDDEYLIALKKEHEFLSAKYNLSNKRVSKERWKMMRIRPANFPTIRIAQLAVLLSNIQNLFSFSIAQAPLLEIVKKVRVPVSDYWRTHHDFGKESQRLGIKIGKGSIENIVINTFVPVLVAYSRYLDDKSFMDHAIALLENTKAENNHIIRKWESKGIKSNSAYDSQALIMQYNELCKKKKCVHCSIGISLLNK